MRFLLFILLLNLLLVALNVRAYRWLNQAFDLSRAHRRALIGIMAASLIVSGVGRMLSRAGYELSFEWPLVLAFAIQLTIVISVILLFVLDVARLLTRASNSIYAALRKRRKQPMLEQAAAAPSTSNVERPASMGPEALTLERSHSPPAMAAENPVELRGMHAQTASLAGQPNSPFSRRDFALKLAVGSTFLVGGTSSAYGALIGRHDYVIEEVPVRIPGLRKAFDGFSIVQLSDLHIGQFVGEPELSAAADLVRQAKPDLIVLTGDLIDHDPRVAPTLGRFVRRLSPLAKQGVAVISGNHDYYAGITPTLSAVRAGGGRVLSNEGVVVGDETAGFALLGVNDVRASRFGVDRGPDVARAIDSLPKLAGRVSAARDLPRVLLCHNPVYFEEAQYHVALQMSGHTHGGQVNLMLRPADWVLPNGWVAGLYAEGESQLYVNRGFGTVGPPARVGAAPEVTRIVLTS